MNTKKELIQAIRNGFEPTFSYFWGVTDFYKQPTPLGCLNLWSPHSITDGTRTFNCGEQAMVVTKALMFGDVATADAIMKITRPIDMKAKVVGIDKEQWSEHLFNVLVRINVLKAIQHREVMDTLMATGEDILVGASTYDTVLGIGTYAARAKKLTVEEWEGENVLGFAWMAVRDQFNDNPLPF